MDNHTACAGHESSPPPIPTLTLFGSFLAPSDHNCSPKHSPPPEETDIWLLLQTLLTKSDLQAGNISLALWTSRDQQQNCLHWTENSNFGEHQTAANRLRKPKQYVNDDSHTSNYTSIMRTATRGITLRLRSIQQHPGWICLQWWWVSSISSLRNRPQITLTWTESIGYKAPETEYVPFKEFTTSGKSFQHIKGIVNNHLVKQSI